MPICTCCRMTLPRNSGVLPKNTPRRSGAPSDELDRDVAASDNTDALATPPNKWLIWLMVF